MKDEEISMIPIQSLEDLEGRLKKLSNRVQALRGSL
jgi:hypothetical protein